MGRSNNSARQRNSKGRLNRRQQGEARRPADRAVPRVAIDQMVMPDGTCLRNSQRPKAKFDTAQKAQKALEQAQRQRARAGSGHVEKRFYLCRDVVGMNDDGTPRIVGCGGYHLTSREEYDPSINSSINRTIRSES